MNDRFEQRKDLVAKVAKDSNVNRLAELFLSQYKYELEGLEEGGRIPSHVPVGRDKFVDWLKDVIKQFFPMLIGITENERTLKDYATQVADAVAKSNTEVQNPLRDYKVSDEPVFIKAFCRQVKTAESPFGTVLEQFRYDQEGNYTGHDKPEQNVKHETHPFWNKRKIKPFLQKNEEIVKVDPKIVDVERPYDVFKDNESLIEPNVKKESKLTKLFKSASPQLFAPTTMPTRYCPDHPGVQLEVIADGVRRCPLDGKSYDFQRGFTTEDGVKHNGGSVANQNAIPPGTSLIYQKKAQLLGGEPQKVHAFLYQLISYLPAESRERRILNYKFQNNISLEEAIRQIEESERLAAEQKSQEVVK